MIAILRKNCCSATDTTPVLWEIRSSACRVLLRVPQRCKWTTSSLVSAATASVAISVQLIALARPIEFALIATQVGFHQSDFYSVAHHLSFSGASTSGSGLD